MIDRDLKKNIEKKLNSGKVLLVLGARQTGKTTLLKEITNSLENVLWLNGDEPDIKELLEGASSQRLKLVFGKNKLVVIDEAQRINNIGVILKLIADEIKEIQVLVTGSSALELGHEIKEPLTGRKWEYHLYPISFGELVSHDGLIKETRSLPHRLVYGSYPEVINHPGEEKEILKQLADSYLYKDLLMMEGIKKPEKLIKLLQALAYQVGSEVNYTELGRTVGMNNETVEKYIGLLEKAFVIFKLNALSRNLRNEIKKGKKIYFYDNGILNALTFQFQAFEIRKDKGALWENYIISERQKVIQYKGIWTNKYFWRTHEQQEIDYVEERDGKFYAYEIKWNPKSKAKFSKSFIHAYPNCETKVIHPKNIEEFLLVE